MSMILKCRELRADHPLMLCTANPQWTGNAPSGLADVMYLLMGGVQYNVLQEHEHELLSHYYQELTAALAETGHVDNVYPRYGAARCTVCAET